MSISAHRGQNKYQSPGSRNYRLLWAAWSVGSGNQTQVLCKSSHAPMHWAIALALVSMFHLKSSKTVTLKLCLLSLNEIPKCRLLNPILFQLLSDWEGNSQPHSKKHNWKPPTNRNPLTNQKPPTKTVSISVCFSSVCFSRLIPSSQWKATAHRTGLWV